MEETKPFKITKQAVKIAFDRVKANKGTYGIDEQTIEDFEENLKDNLYKIWNRMSSGTYFPKPVKAVAIPKKNGGIRILGIPTVEDRVAQMVAKIYFELNVEKIFYEDSYGYRLNKSAIQAVGVLRERCWRKDWVVDFELCYVLAYINKCISKWVKHKYKKVKSRRKAGKLVTEIAKREPKLFAHWKFGVIRTAM